MTALLIVSALVVLTSFLFTGVTLRYLRTKSLLDHPNERSSHTIPVPRGAGLSVIIITMATWVIPLNLNLQIGEFSWRPMGLVIAACGLLAFISWLDDLKSLSPILRFSIHGLAVAIGISALPYDSFLFAGVLPQWADTLMIFIGWLWFVNLFNFMDGIDGISGVETLGICIGVFTFSMFYEISISAQWQSLTLGAAVLGFLWWNLPPARIFLGDVGSVPIGFLLGWILLNLAFAGYWISALILPLYYLSDATYTLGKRGLRGEKVWRAHREHFYQQAVRSGKSHGAVSKSVGLANLALIVLSLTAVSYPTVSLISSAIVVTILINWMRS